MGELYFLGALFRKTRDLLHKSKKGVSEAVARNERQHLRIKTLILPIYPDANASPLQLKIDFCKRSKERDRNLQNTIAVVGAGIGVAGLAAITHYPLPITHYPLPITPYGRASLI